MTMKIGIFETENQAVAAVEALEQEGFTKTEIKVLAKDWEHSRRIESVTNVHADEIYDLVDTREDAGERSVLGLGFVPAAGLAGGIYSAGTLNGFGGPFANGTALAAAAFLNDSNAVDQALFSLGLTDESAIACRKAIVEGGLAVAADIGSAEGNGGPDLTRSGAAEAALRRSGAQRIL